MPWYALWVDGGRELAVSDQLQARDVETFCPYIRKRRWRRGRRILERRALFSSYCFIALRDPQWLRPTTWGIIGVRNLVRFDSQAPAAIPDPVMRKLFSQVDDKDEVTAPTVVPGKRYKIACNHALAGLIGLVETVAGDECRLWVELIGKQHLVTIRTEDLDEA